MNHHQYKSIIRLFEYCGIDGNKLDVGRIRKIISAEFALAESGIISIDGFDYSKNEAIAETEAPDFLKRYSHHKTIWNNKTFLNCLERNNVASPDFSPFKHPDANLDFARFVSPYFAVSFDKIMRKYLRDFDLKSANNWAKNITILNAPDDEDRALYGTRLYCAEFISRLKNSNNVTYVEMIHELNAWAKSPISSELLNRLMTFIPDIVNNLARALVNFTVTIQFKDKNLCHRVSCRLLEIQNLDAELSALILGNHEIYRSKLLTRKNRILKRICIPIFFFFIALRICSVPQWNERHESYNHAKSLREFLRNNNLDKNRTDLSYADNDPLDNFATKTLSLRVDSFPYHVSNKKHGIDPRLFEDLRRRYAHVERKTLDSTPLIHNLALNQLCYLRLFHAARHVDTHAVLDIENKTNEAVTLHIDGGESSLVSMVIEPKNKLKLQRPLNRLEILLKPSVVAMPMPVKDSFIVFLVKSLLVCDERNVPEHTFDSFPDTCVPKVDTDNPDKETDFKLILLPGNKPTEIHLCFTTGFVGN